MFEFALKVVIIALLSAFAAGAWVVVVREIRDRF